MARAIGFIKHPTGRLGNIVLQYIFLKEMAFYIDAPVFHGNLYGSEFFEDFERTNHYYRYRILERTHVHYGAEDIEKNGIKDFCEQLKNTDDIIILEPPLLGFTWETMFAPVDKMLKLKSAVKKSYINYDDFFTIAIHFRGSDFLEWDSNAYYDKEYYIKAIEYCLKQYTVIPKIFMLYADDLEMDAYNDVLGYLEFKKEKVYKADPDRNLGKEIYNMSKADILISSPSTFAVIASLLANNQIIIHKKEWIDYCIERGDRFWMEIKEKNIYGKFIVI